MRRTILIVKAAVAWYGPLQFPKSDNTPVNPADEVAQMKAPVLGLYGGADASITAAQVDAMRAAIKAADKSSEIIVYPDTPHAFNADYRPSYRPKAAKDGMGADAGVVQEKRRRVTSATI